MRCHELLGRELASEWGQPLYDLAERLFPLARSLTGDGVRDTLSILAERLPVTVHEVPSGTSAFDWVVPDEWNVSEAYIAVDGERIVDAARSNLHVLGYSVPVHERMRLADLQAHLHSIPEHPDWIPYRTSYYEARWGFCVSHRQRDALADVEYEVRIDSSLAPGSLTYGECVLPGETDREVLISTHTCHPSLANDNCSGLVVAGALASILASLEHRFTYRFVFAPGTIGSLVWLSRNEAGLDRIDHGLVLSNVGDPGPFTYKRSRRGAMVDRAVECVLGTRAGARVVDFEPFGYDERQYCAPGFDLPVGSFSRTPYGQYPEYHTSADDLQLIAPTALGESLETLVEVIDVLERDGRHLNRSPKGEPQLGRRGLYASLGGTTQSRDRELALLWVLNLSDGGSSLLDIARRSGRPFADIADAAQALGEVGLLELLP